MSIVPALVVAGTHSGAGKTTVTLAILAALVRRGLRVQAFKVGPDFIDPGHHTHVTGRISRNLDTWLLDDAALAATYLRASEGADIAIVEGVMGLFDGRSGLDEAGSTADLARKWDLPVALVVDARGLARSIAPMVHGFATFDSLVRVRGVIANRVGGPKHYSEYLAPALRASTAIEPIGFLARDESLAIPSRHLGLVTAEEWGLSPIIVSKLADAAESTLNLDRLIALAQRPRILSIQNKSPTISARSSRIAVARDAAFCFYYEDNLDHFRDAGAEIIPFSPLNDHELPGGTSLLYLGGGYPEVFAARLASNTAMRAAIRRFHAEGGVILAECGGMMACCRELSDASGATFPMWDLIPARVVMTTQYQALGYVTIQTMRDTPLGPSGTGLRGHEFHYSRLEPLGNLPYFSQTTRPDREPRFDGVMVGGLLAGYAHMHFGSNGEVAGNLLAS